MNVRVAFAMNRKVCFIGYPDNDVYEYCVNEGQVSKRFRHTVAYNEFFLDHYLKSVPSVGLEAYIPSICQMLLYLLECLVVTDYKTPVCETKLYACLMQYGQSGFTLRKKVKMMLMHTAVTRRLLARIVAGRL